MSSDILLLNYDFQIINLITIKKAMRLICKNKVEVIKSTNEKIHSNMFKPKVIKLLKSISNLYNRKMPWSKQNILIRDQWLCAYCGDQLTNKNATIDHIIPRSKGGDNSWLNTISSCKKCNGAKDDKLLHETNMKLRFQPHVPNLIEFISIKFKGYEWDMS